jgi:hypothetical protein
MNSVILMDGMILEFLAQREVQEVLLALVWGDRFEKDLACKFSNIDTFYEIRDRLLRENLVYKFLGENGSPYLSLTDKGIAVVNRLVEIKRIVEGEDLDSE